MSMTIKYVYKKVKMKNVTMLLWFCWLLWISQIIAISTMFQNGMPDLPATPSIITLVKNTAEVKLEKVLQEELVIDTNGTSTVDPSLSIVDILKSHVDQISENNTKDENVTAEAIPMSKEIEFPQDVPPDGQNIGINDSGGLANGNGTVKETQKSVDDAKLLNLTVDENQIPVFSEWAQKRMEEAEKKMEQDSVNTSMHKKNSTTGNKTPVIKLRVKNYASPDCGAKIIAANSEASSTGSVLSTTKDEYLLSPCTSRIWFVVELCEAIQAEIVDLANFELFSSSPKNFSVSVSNRFPTREWSNVGKFTAKDERNIQTFDLFPHLFGKYVRVDIHSHYNSEHFCPISLFRVYGTSEFEAFETENRVHVEEDIDDDEPIVEQDAQKLPKKNDDNNIFKSASDAVMSIVKKAASFVKPNENKTNAGSVDLMPNSIINAAGCMTPNFEIVCRNCSQNVSDDVNHLLSCKQRVLTSLLSVDLIRNSIYKSQICANLVGVELSPYCREIFSNVSVKLLTDFRKDYISNLIPISYVAAMCNILATTQRQQTSHPSDIPVSGVPSADINSKEQRNIDSMRNDSQAKFKNQNIDSGQEHKVDKQQEDVLPEQPKIPQDREKMLNFSEQPVSDGHLDTKDYIADTPKDGTPIQTIEIQNNETNEIDPDLVVTNNNKSDPQPKLDNSEDSKDNILDEAIGINNTWEGIDEVFLTETPVTTTEPVDGSTTIVIDDQATATVINPPIGQQKVHSESVFLRLSNRIKALERNMSLSGQYLEELSRRYKKQVEELQQSFAKTLLMVEEQNRKNSEREHMLNMQIHTLRNDVEQLTNRIFSWSNICFYIGGFAFVQVSVIWIILRIWSQRNNNYDSPSNGANPNRMKNNIKAVLVRRKSLDASGDISPISSKKRRPSEEALNITGTYKDLLILEEADIGNQSTEEYDSFGEINKKKAKQKSRKVAGSKRLPQEQNEKRKKNVTRQESAPGEYEIFKETPLTSKTRQDDHPVLDEDYEIYLPGSDLVYNEFMPDGPSGVENLNHITNGDTASTVNGKTESKTRRLSSPAFLKSPFSRSQRKKNSHETATGWEWYRLKREPQSASQQKNKKSKSESPEVKTTTNGIIKTDGTKESKDSIKTSASFVSGSSDKKQGSFRRILKKVF